MSYDGDEDEDPVTVGRRIADWWEDHLLAPARIWARRAICLVIGHGPRVDLNASIRRLFREIDPDTPRQIPPEYGCARCFRSIPGDP